MITSFTNFYCPQRSWGKVMFLDVSVILFTGGGIPACITGGIPACLAVGIQRGGIPACLAGFQAHTQREVEGDLARGVSRPTPRGSIPACTEADPPPTATAAGGTHPTGMHSCLFLLFHIILLLLILYWWLVELPKRLKWGYPWMSDPILIFFGTF